MKTKEFTLSLDAANTVRHQLAWIKGIFDQVDITFDNSGTSSRTKIEWIYVRGEDENLCEKAKNYITSLTNPSKYAVVKVPTWFQTELFSGDCKLLKSLERESAAVIETSADQISIQGIDELTVVVAKSLVDEKLKEVTKNRDTNENNFKDEHLLCINVNDSVKQFAIKLGYDDNDIMLAAKKCKENGKAVNENTLLQELVKQCPQKLKDTVFKTDLTKEEDKFFVEIAKTLAEVTTAQTTTQSSSNSVCESLREIVIDGSNVAMCHGHKEVFSCNGIQIVVQWFKQRGHQNIVVFVPQWRQEAPKPDSPITHQEILAKLEKEKILVFTPSRRINGRRVVCYDDRYIVKYAFEKDCVIVSNDNFRDLQKENPEWKAFLEQRLLMYSFVNDRFMPPDDPLGRCGPTLEEFLKKGSSLNRPCPYKNKCTYGSKCRYYHPEKDTTTSTTKKSSYVSLLDMQVHPQHQRRNSPTPYPVSCAVEHKLQEGTQHTSPYQQDVIARGSIPSIQTTEYLGRGNQFTNGPFNNRHEWQNKSQEIYQNPYYQSSPVHAQHSRSPYYLSTHPSYHSHSRSWESPYHPQDHAYTQNCMYSPSTQPNQYVNINQPSPYVPQSVGPQSAYSVTPSSTYAQLGIMPGYVDPRTIDHYYRAPRQMHGHLAPPVVMPVETPLVQETRSTQQYLLRSEPRLPLDEFYYQQLMEMFPDRSQTVQRVLGEHPNERDLNILASYILAD